MVMSSDMYADDDFAIQMLVAGMVRHEDNVEAVDAPADNSNDNDGALLQPLRQHNDSHNASIAFRDQHKHNATPVSVLQSLYIDVESNVLEPQDKGCPVLRLGSIGNGDNDLQQGVIYNVSKELNKVNLALSTEEEQQVPQIHDKENLYTLVPTKRKVSRDSFIVLESNNTGSGLSPPRKKFRKSEAASSSSDDDILARHIKVSKYKSFLPRPGMSSSILVSSSSFTRPKTPPPMMSENGTQTGNYSIHHVPIDTSWTLPMPWGVIPSGKTMSTQTPPKDTVEPLVQENISKEELSFKFDQDFEIFRDDNNDDSFGSIDEFVGIGILDEPDHSGVYNVNVTGFIRNISTNTIHVPWRRVTRRVPKLGKWLKASKTWSKSKELSTFGTQTEEHAN